MLRVVGRYNIDWVIALTRYYDMKGVLIERPFCYAVNQACR